MVPKPFFVLLIGIIVAGGSAGVAAIMFQRASPWPTVRPGGEFTAIDTADRRVTQADFLGKPAALYFGYTYCPDACPTALFTLSQSLRELGPLADKLNVAFVTVDPERDTPAQLKLYLESFDPRIRGLTGTKEQISMMARRYHVTVRRVPTSDGNYAVDHSTSVMLFDRDGRQVGAIEHSEGQDSFTGKLKRLINPNACIPNAPASMWEASVVKGGAAKSCL